jgi:hypothetical protein
MISKAVSKKKLHISVHLIVKQPYFMEENELYFRGSKVRGKDLLE